MSTTRLPLVQQDSSPVKPVHVADQAVPAKQPHEYTREGGYVTQGYVHQEYPKALYRVRNAEEIQLERDNLSYEQWLDKDFDLLLATGHNQKRNKQSYDAWAMRHVDAVANDAKQEAAMRKEGFKSLAEHQPK